MRHNKETYNAYLDKQGPSRFQLWSYTTALLYRKLMRLRYEMGQQLFIIQKDELVRWTPQRSFSGWPEIYEHFIQVEKKNKNKKLKRSRDNGSGTSSSGGALPMKFIKPSSCV